MAVKISDYLDPKMVTFLDLKTRDKVIAEMVSLFEKEGKITEFQPFYEAVIEREKIVTTGIGMGVAIPHAKFSVYDDFFIAIAVLKKGVDWGALDGTPVRVAFLIGGPDDKQTEYLQILSGLTLALKDNERRKKILSTTTAEDVVELFEGF